MAPSELSISGDSRVVFWWDRYGNHRLSFLKRAGLPFFQNGFAAIYFGTIFIRQFRKVVILVLQKCGDYFIVIDGRWTPFEISGCAIDLVDVAQCRSKCKQLFMFYTFLWTCWVTEYSQISRVGNFLPRTCRGRWRRGMWRKKCHLGRCMNQSWGAQARILQQDVLAQWFIDITEFFPDTIVFYD